MPSTVPAPSTDAFSFIDSQWMEGGETPGAPTGRSIQLPYPAGGFARKWALRVATTGRSPA